MSCDNKRGYTSDPQPPVAAETPEQIAPEAIKRADVIVDHAQNCPLHMIRRFIAVHIDSCLRDQARQYDARIAELERWRQYWMEHAESAEAERYAAVGQVAVLKSKLMRFHDAIVKLRHELRVHARTKPFNGESYISGRKRADAVLASTKSLILESAPLVAAYKAEIEAGALEEAADLANKVPFNHTVADWIRTRAQEKRKAGAQAH